MKYAADFRSIARESLRGKWLFAVAAGLVAVLLGGISSDGPEIKFHVDAAGASASLELAGQNIYSTSKGLGPELSTFLIGARRKILCKRFSTKSRMALENRADSGLDPLITESHGGQNGMCAGTA